GSHRAPPCPAGARDLILGGAARATLLHVTIGRALAFDRARGLDLAGDGASYATPDKLRALRLGSEHANLVADATLPFGLATAAYDDEGVPAGRWELVRDGIVVGFLTNRALARGARGGAAGRA